LEGARTVAINRQLQYSYKSLRKYKKNWKIIYWSLQLKE
jgi:hypothetical protein